MWICSFLTKLCYIKLCNFKWVLPLYMYTWQYSAYIALLYLHFWLLLKNSNMECFDFAHGCCLGGPLPSLRSRWWCNNFSIFYEFFNLFFWKKLKFLYHKNYLANCFDIAHRVTWSQVVLILATRWRCDFSYFLMNFCVLRLFSSSAPEWLNRIAWKFIRIYLDFRQ